MVLANKRAITKSKAHFFSGMTQDPKYILGLKFTNIYSCLKLKDQRETSFRVHGDKAHVYLEWEWEEDKNDSSIYWAFNKHIFNGQKFITVTNIDLSRWDKQIHFTDVDKNML